MTDRLRILVRLKEGYGFGDGVQMSVVLRHLAKHRPNWQVDYQCRRGAHECAVGLCHAVFTDDSPAPGPYDQVIEVHPHDALYNFDDQPNTKVTSTLHEYFGLPWDAYLGRYVVNVPEQTREKARRMVESWDKPIVLVHYQGASSAHRKDLADWQAKEICQGIIAAGQIPIILDRDEKSPVPDGKTIFRCRPEGAALLAGVIGQAAAFIGIDSGPGHLAASTDTPTAIVWTKNHPCHFFDLAPNVLHLVRHDHRSLPPADDEAVFRFFHENYDYRTYTGEGGVVAEVYRWLSERFALPLTALPPLQVVVRQDMTSICWALTKVRPIAQGRKVSVIVDTEAERAVDPDIAAFLQRLSFVQSVRGAQVWLQPRERPVNTRGQHIYSASGRDFDGRFRIVPETALEDGRSMDEWLAEYPPDWDWPYQLRRVEELPEHIRRELCRWTLLRDSMKPAVSGCG